MSIGKRIQLALGVAAIVATPLAARGEEPAPQGPLQIKRVDKAQVFQVQAPGGRVRQIQIQAPNTPPRIVYVPASQRAPVGKYWIGVGCEAVDEALRAQLGIEQGLVLTQVNEEQPAEKAGLQQYDVLLRFGEQKLAEVSDLIKAIDASEGKKSTVVLLRRGKEIKIDLTPIKRPGFDEAVHERNLTWQKVVPHLVPEALKDRLQANDGVRMLHFGPGLFLKSRNVSLPADVTVTLKRQGDNPPQIIVKQGEKSWDVTEETLDQLPEELRDAVKGVLGQAQPTFVPSAPPSARPPQAPGAPAHPPATGPEFRLRLRDLQVDEAPMQKQLGEVMKQLKEIREQMERDGAFDSIREEMKSLRRDIERLQKERDEE